MAKDTSATKPLDPVLRKSVETGLITRGSISENNRPMTSVEEAVNFDFDTIGAGIVRKGVTMVGPSLNTETSTDVGMVYGSQYGKFNQGAGFLQNAATIDYGNYAIPLYFTYSLWFKTTQTGASANPTLISFEGDYVLSIDKTTGGVNFKNGSSTTTFGAGYNDGNWHHVALTFSEGVGAIVIDGFVAGDFSEGYVTGTSDLISGSVSPSSGSDQFIGSLDDVALFTRILSYADILALYGGELVTTYLISDKSLLGYWQFEGNSNPSIAPILGMHYYVDTLTNGLNTHLIVVVGTQAFIYINALSFSFWNAVRTGLSPGSPARFSTYLNYVFMVNGTEGTAVWDGILGDSFIYTGNALNAPTGQYIENFRSRMWIAGNSTYPDRLYYSSIPTSVTTPIIVWNTDIATGQWIDISPSDGDTITGLQRFRNKMLVFKTNHIYRVFDIGQIDPDPWYPVGTYSQESVVETKTGVFFHHSTGFYQYNPYDIVQEISRPIIDIIKAIPTSSYSSVTGWLEADGDHVCWSVGNVVVRGVLFKNLVVRYSISTQVWGHRSYPTQFVNSIRRQPLFDDGNNQYAVVGDITGNVLETNSGLTDNGASIPFSLIHAWDNLDGLLSTRKTVMVANFTHYNGTGAQVTYQTEEQDPDDLQNWKGQVGTLKDKNTGFNSINIKGRKIRFRISGQSSGQQFFYNGYEIIGATDELYQFPN